MKEITVSVTGAAGQIGYAILFRIASGEVFGPDTLLNLQLLELDNALPMLDGVKMEIEDGAFPNVKSITTTSNLHTAFEENDWTFLIGSLPRKAGMERKDLISANAKIFTVQGKALDEAAKPNCRILVVGNPCNTNAYIAKSACRRLNPKNFFAMTALDEKRARACLAKYAKVPNQAVKNMAIWGNHSSTQFPDFYNATINGEKATKIINNETWLQGEFISTIQQRGAAIIKARGASSAASAANAAISTVKSIITPTPKNEWFSAAVCSDGSYDIEKGLVFGYPLQSDGNNWKIVQNLTLNPFSQQKIKATEKELQEEREAVKHLL